MNEVPEEAGTRPEPAATTAELRGTNLGRGGSVRVHSSAESKGVADAPIRPAQVRSLRIAAVLLYLDDWGNATANQPPGATERGGSGATGAPAERPAGAGAEAEGASEGGPTGPTENERRSAEHDRAERGIPSSGWREVAAACHATGGQTHEADPGLQYPASYAAFRGQRGRSRASQALTRHNRGERR